jgi:hypothetical protein
MLAVETPIFIVGTGRCGSTLFHHVLSHHPHVTWLSRACERQPRKPEANRRAIRTLDLLPLPSRYIRKLIYPVEAYEFWERICPGFKEPCRDLLKEDVTPRVKKSVLKVMAQMLTKRRRRLLVKITGWPRIGFLKGIFPDAKFIHIYRDGRAVVNSLLSVTWWSGWRGPDNWRWGELTPAQREKWERFDQSFVALAAIQWEILMAAHEEAKHKVPVGDLLEIRYEDMCQDPVQALKTATEFCDLVWLPEFESTIHRFTFKNTNHKWQEHLSDAQQNILNACLHESLQKYGYV